MTMVGIDGRRIMHAKVEGKTVSLREASELSNRNSGVTLAYYTDSHGVTRVTRLVSLDSRLFAGARLSSGAALPLVSGFAAKSLAAPAADTVRISKAGYRTRKTTIDSLVASMGDIVLLASDPVEGAPSMVLIPALDSVFRMGDSLLPDYSRASYRLPYPEHYVKLTYDYWVDTTEVTQKDYHELMLATYPGYSVPPWDTLSKGKGDDYPAYYMSWYDAALYCNARSKRDGLDTVYTFSSIEGTPGSDCTLGDMMANMDAVGYRMLTEAEFEYATCAGAATRFPWGDSFVETTAKQVAWYNANAGGRTHPVATKLPNGFGLYDMGGNVWEWAHNWMYDYPRNTMDDPLVDPTGPATGTSVGNWKPKRGGGWSHDGLRLSHGYRADYKIGVQKDYVGFRVALPVRP